MKGGEKGPTEIKYQGKQREKVLRNPKSYETTFVACLYHLSLYKKVFLTALKVALITPSC